MKVFLGGTCNKTTWREELIPLLRIDYFNPVVKDWTPECQEIEKQQKELCDIHLYCITKEMTGVFSIAEMVDSVHMNKQTIVCIVPDGFDEFQLRSLSAVVDLINTRGGLAVVQSDYLVYCSETVNSFNTRIHQYAERMN
jgi:hypothetical protein